MYTAGAPETWHSPIYVIWDRDRRLYSTGGVDGWTPHIRKAKRWKYRRYAIQHLNLRYDSAENIPPTIDILTYMCDYRCIGADPAWTADKSGR